MTLKEKIKVAKEQTKESAIDRLFGRKKLPKKSLGIGIHNDVFYFGTNVEIEGKQLSAIITSDRKFYIGSQKPNQIKIDFGLNYQSEFDEEILSYPWSNESIKAYLENKNDLWPLKKIFEEIRRLNKTYVSHEDERIHDYIACDIISNYYNPIFDTKGRTYYNAEKGSGKSRQARIYELLSFNSMLSNTITPSAIYRTTEATGCTHIIDNYDGMNEDLRKEINNLIQVGYMKNSKRILTGEKKRRIEKYSVYSPMVINNIIGLDSVTQDRVFVIKMLKNRKMQKVKPNSKDSIWEEIRDQLRYNSLDRWLEIKDCYEKLNVEGLSGRELEVVESVLCIANSLGKEVYADVLGLILDTFASKKLERDLSTDWTYLTYQKAFDHLGDKEEAWISLSNLSQDLTPVLYGVDPEDRKSFLRKKISCSKQISKIFGRNSLIGKEERKTERNYAFVKLSKKRINKWLEANDYPTLTYLNNINNPPNTNNLNTLNSEGREVWEGVKVEDVSEDTILDFIQKKRTTEDITSKFGNQAALNLEDLKRKGLAREEAGIWEATT